LNRFYRPNALELWRSWTNDDQSLAPVHCSWISEQVANQVEKFFWLSTQEVVVGATATRSDRRMQKDNWHFVGRSFYSLSHSVTVNAISRNQHGRGHVWEQLKEIQRLTRGVRGQDVELSGLKYQLAD
jgi:hypothetical protein